MYLFEQYKDLNTRLVNDDMQGGQQLTAEQLAIVRGEQIMWSWMNDRCSTKYSDTRAYRESRLYAQGKQSNIKYMDRMCPVIKKGKNAGKRRTYVNISWDVFPIFVRFRKKLLGYLLKYDFFPNCTCLDELSDTDRNEAKMSLTLKMMYGEFMQDMNNILGIKDDQQDLPFKPKNLQEIEMISAVGGFKLWQEIAMEFFVKRSYTMSDWEVLRVQMLEDLIDLGVVIIRDILSPETMRPKVVYADPEWTIIEHTRNLTSLDVTAAAEIKFYSAGELMKKYPTITKKQMAEAINNNNQNFALMAAYAGSTNYNENNLDGAAMNTKIAVLEYEYLTYDNKKYKTTKLPSGAEAVKPVKNGADIITNEPTWMEAVWVIGTKYCLEHGPRKNAPYLYNNEKCRSSYTMYRADERSMVDICKPTIDEICMTIYKIRSAQLTAKPSGMNIDVGALANISMGGEKLEILDVLRLRRETGDMLYRGRTGPNGQPMAGAGEPVSENVGGIGPLLNELLLLFTTQVNSLRELTGLNSIVDSSSPNPETLVGTAKIAQEAADDVLRPIIEGYKITKKLTTENLAMRWQFLSQYFPDKVEEFSREIGEIWAKYLEQGSKLPYYKYGFDFDVEINPQVIQDIKQAAQMAMMGGQNQGPMITYNDYFYIMRLVERGNLKLAQMYLSYKEIEAKENQAKVAEENAMNNVKGQQLAEQQKADAIINQIQLETAAKLKIIEAEGQQDRLTLQTEYKLKAELPVGQSASS